MKKSIIVDPDKCIGCRMCEAVCSLVHYGEIGISNSRIKVIRYDNDAFFNPIVCMQCARPYCADACPSQAISTNKKTGIVQVSKNKCNGCKACLAACPFGAMAFFDDLAIKCDLCGGKPHCVEFCQAKALTFAEPNEISKAKRIALSDKALQESKQKLTI